MIVDLFEIVLLLIFGIFPIYLALLSILALLPVKIRSEQNARKKSFAIVVPAHNEELVIGKTLKSLSSIEYPRELFDVIVIADNCTDQTANIVRSAGAAAYERSNRTEVGKGYALRWGFDKILGAEKKYDAIVVIDADCEVTPNMLSILHTYLHRGARVVQIADIVTPKPGVWNSEIIRLGFTLYNVVRPLGKRLIGCSVGLRGTGMCFAADILRDIPWQAYSFAEDLEYGLNLVLHGIKVDFAPEAAVISAMPDQSNQSETQRARWESGRKPLVRHYSPKLLSQSLRKLSYPLFDTFLDLVMPPFVNLSVMIVFIILLHAFFFVLGIELLRPYLWIWVAVLGAAFTHALLGLIAAKADRHLYKSLLYVPRYAFWKLTLYVKLMTRGGPSRWVRTERNIGDR
jgi:1,2-diacylglycerol 3-beta-glucosyltransferase